MDRWLDGWIGGVDGWTDDELWMDDEWMDRQMDDKWMYGWMNGQTSIRIKKTGEHQTFFTTITP